MGVTRFNPKALFSGFSFRRRKARASSSTPAPALSANTSQDTIQHGDTTSNGQHAFLNITAHDTRRPVSAPGIRDSLQVPHEATPRTGAPASVRSVSTGTSQALTRSSSPNSWPASTPIPPHAKDTLTIEIAATKRINPWQEAQAKLPKERRERLLKGASCDINDINLVESLINEVKEKKQSIDETKRWYHEYMGSTLEQLQKYAIIGDIAIQHNPHIVALAWAGFRFLLNVVSAHTENMKSIGESFSKLLRIICCCDIYERLYINESLAISGQLVDSIVDLYVAVLEYLFYAEEHVQKGTAAQVCNSFLDGSKSMLLHMQDLERDVINKAGVAEKEAAGAGRTLQIENAETLKRLLGELQAPLTKIQSSVERMLAIVQGGRRSEILMWLSKMPFDDHHVYFSKRRREGTGGWLLQHEKYGAWKISDKSSTFWLRGGAGCGKSYLASRIVDHFREEARNLRGSGYAVAYFYCHYSEEGRNNPESILRTIVKQLCFAMGGDSETLPRAILAIYEKREKHGHSSGPLSVEESRDLIIDLCRGFTKVTLIIDALDECNKEKRRHLFRALNRIASESNLVKIFVTGRNSEDIQNTLLDHSSHHIDATDNTRDIDHYIETEIERRSNPMELEDEEVPLLEGDFVSKELKDHIKSTLKEKANGMFIWAQFQIVAICNESTETDVRNALGFLPKDLDATYGRIIDGIESQTSSCASVAKKVLKWISFAQEPSSIDTIIQSLAVEPNKKLPNKGQLEWTLQRVLGACQNLVIFDETLGICLTLLTYDPESIEGFQLPDLGVYAVEHWGTHARLSGPLSVGGCMAFLKHPTAYRKWGLQVRDEETDLLRESDGGGLVTPFWVACYYGLPHALERFKPSQVNTGNHRGTTPLLIATKRKHVNIIRMVLAMDGVDVNATDKVGRVPLSVAAYAGDMEIVAMLLAADGVDVNAGPEDGTALWSAARNGHKEIVAVLLAVDGVDVNRGAKLGTALSQAARKGHKEIVAMLLAVDGVDVNAPDMHISSPLHSAVIAGHKEIVTMLLAVDGVDVNAPDWHTCSPLQSAVIAGDKEIVALLLAVDGVDVNAPRLWPCCWPRMEWT
ncbi:hypothetical protein DFP73DRAFT_222812 [Morchella snyderi]|nr:hypothetical protein DFP73DRAFT_222812 [Morchella snyderi]